VSTYSRQSKTVIHIIIQQTEVETHHAQFHFKQNNSVSYMKNRFCLALQSSTSFAVFITCAKVTLIQPFNNMPALHICHTFYKMLLAWLCSVVWSCNYTD